MSLEKATKLPTVVNGHAEDEMIFPEVYSNINLQYFSTVNFYVGQ